MVYNRWGRVGMKGQSKLHGPYTSEQGAINEFELKFRSKTKNHWSDRKQFTYHSKCYTLLEMDYEGSQGTGNEAVTYKFFGISKLNYFPLNSTWEHCLHIINFHFLKNQDSMDSLDCNLEVAYLHVYYFVNFNYLVFGATILQVETRIEKPLTVNKKSQLDPRLAQFISLICNINMMKQHMLMIGWFGFTCRHDLWLE